MSRRPAWRFPRNAALESGVLQRQPIFWPAPPLLFGLYTGKPG